MEFTEQQVWVASTLSPIHIGCGLDYEPTNYVVDDDALYFLDDTGVQHGLSASDMEALAKAAVSQGGLTRIRRTLHERRSQLKLFARHVVPMHPSMAAESEQAIDNDRALMEFGRTAHNPHDHQPYLPGSSLKGSIRTALLDSLYKGGISVDPRKLKQGGGAAARHARDVNRELQQSSLGYDGVDTDPMKLLRISDAPFSADLVPTRLVYALNRRRGRTAEQDGKGPPQALEAIAPGLADAFGITMSRHVAMKGGKRDRQRAVDLPNSLSLADITQAVNQYYRRRLESELARLSDTGLLERNWVEGLSGLLSSELGAALDAGTVMLLRVGRHSGADSVTVQELEHVYIMKKGDRDNKRYERTPTTDWLAADSKKQAQRFVPFGWLLLRSEHVALPNTDAWLDQQAASQRDYTDQWNRLATDAAAAIERREADREEAARQAAAAAAEAELEAQRLASLSPELQKVEVLIARMEKGEGRAEAMGAQLATDLNALIAEAIDTWSAEDRLVLWESAQRLFAHLGVDVKKNKKAKARLRELKGN